MNLKSKLLMIVGSVGISTISAAGLPTNAEETLTITEALSAAVQRGDTVRAQELTECLQVMAGAQKVFQGIADEWDALKAEMSARGGDSDLQTLGLPVFSKIDTLAEEILTIFPEALAIKGGAVPPSTDDISLLDREIENLADALDGFGNRVAKAVKSEYIRSELAEQDQPALRSAPVKETNESVAVKKQAEPTARSIKSRVLKACKNPDVADYLIDQFIPAFGRFLEVNNKNWSNVSEPQLTHYIDHFLRYGGF